MATRWTPSLGDYVDAACWILGTSPEAVLRMPRLSLAESALHAPFASFGGTEAYPTLVGQAAVLIEHLARNHPLPDGNKRVAFLITARFLEANGLDWGAPDADTDATMVERIAAGEAARDEIVSWIERRTR